MRNWTQKEGICKICGKPMMMASNVQKYCAECKDLARRQRAEENRKTAAAKKVAVSRGTDPNRYAGKETECKMKRSCMYGSDKYCEYIAITGRSRLRAGYTIRGGKCGAYKKGPKKRGMMSLPQSPVLPPGKMGEI